MLKSDFCQLPILKEGEEVEFIAVVQHYGLTGNNEQNPTYSQGFHTRKEAEKWLVQYVSEAHGYPATVEHLGARDLSLTVVKSAEGPVWGLITNV